MYTTVAADEASGITIPVFFGISVPADMVHEGTCVPAGELRLGGATEDGAGGAGGCCWCEGCSLG